MYGLAVFLSSVQRVGLAGEAGASARRLPSTVPPRPQMGYKGMSWAARCGPWRRGAVLKRTAMRMKPSLDFGDAEAIAAACKAAAERAGAPVAIAVVDDAGGLRCSDGLGE